MPELPEVEMVVRGIRQPLIGRTLTGMAVQWDRTLATPAPEQFAARLHGQRVLEVRRRAKYIVIGLAHDLLVVHLKMTGRLYLTPADAVHADDRWLRVAFDLDDGQQLRFSDARKFGRVGLVRDLAEFGPGAAALGPEPLEDSFTPAEFYARLHRRGTSIKALLLDQSFVAGVGNIYADEALWRAQIHPLRKADTLSEAEAAALYLAVREALSMGLAHEGASINWYRKPDGSTGEAQGHFFAYGREGLPCARCGSPLSKIRVVQRGTHFCPNCQPVE
jgi:formamidopyrimidine-DNA glycosylase